jgi:hypothetical protein
MAPRKDARDLALASYGKMFENTPIISHITFAVLAVVASILLLRRRRPPDVAMAFLLLGALAFTASFFVISISCDYRYLYALDLSTLVAIFYMSLNARSVLTGTP